MAENVFVGVMGYSGQKFDLSVARTLLNQAFDEIEKQFPDREIWIVSGYTNMGIPAMAYELAAKRGWKTYGIACKKASQYEVYPCDDVELVGDNWGDESPAFLAKCQVFIRVGGGKQSFTEASLAKQAGKTVYEYELPAEK